MRVTAVRTLGFRNLAPAELRLGEGITLLWGPNGAGKSNALEALCLALSGRSCRTRNEREAIAFGEQLARIEVEVADGGETRGFLWSLDRSGERRHLVDDNPVTAEHYELRPPLAIFLPDRLTLVKGPPAVRRTHLDRLCAALWPGRAELRRRYGRALAQRNALLGRIRRRIRARGLAGRLGARAGGGRLGADRDPARGGRPVGAGIRRGGGRALSAGSRRAALPATHRSRRAGGAGGRVARPPGRGPGAGLHGPWPAPRRAGGLARRTPAAALWLAGRATHGGAGASVRRAPGAGRGGSKRPR